MSERNLFGLMAEFPNPELLKSAAKQCHEKGFRELDAFTPFPVEGLAEAIGFKEKWLPFITLAGGIIGGGGTLAVITYLNAVNYPINVGGRALAAWPAFVVPSFEDMILYAAVFAVVGMLWLNGLPRLHHPIFDAPLSSRISLDGFFLVIEQRDPLFDPEEVRQLFDEQGAIAVVEVPG